MNKLMRKSPIIVAVVLMLVQISGLAMYANSAAGMSDGRQWAFAVALEVGVFGAAYFIRYKGAIRWAALSVLIMFLSVSATLNTFKSLRDLPANHDEIALVSALIFGIVPSLFATVLGVLQAYVEGLPPIKDTHAGDTPLMQVYAIAVKALRLIDARMDSANVASSAHNANQAHDDMKKCPQCNAWVHNVGSHVRWKHGKAVTK